MALVNIQVPDIGDFDEVGVIELLVKVGDTVKAEQSLITVESDKASMEIPSSHAGVVKELKVQLGDKVKQGSVIAVLEAAGEAAASDEKPAPAPAAQAPAAIETQAPAAAAAPAAPAAGGGAVEVRVPDIGDFKDVAVIELLVQPGDAVKVEQSLFTVESDKASMEIPSPAAGVLKELKVKIGDKINVGDLVAVLEGAATAPAAAPAQGSTPAAASAPAAAAPVAAQASAPAPAAATATATAPVPAHQPSTPTPGLPHASPSVRKFARELGVDLAQVPGSGPKQRIQREDVAAFVRQQLSETAQRGAIPPIPAVDFSKFGPIERQPLSRVQRRSGPNLHRSWLNIPHVTQFDEADITELEDFRKANQARAEKRGVKLTLLAFLLDACAHALREFPAVNASLDPDGEHLILKQYIHIGVAVDTPDGLMVPVVRDVDKKGVFELAAEVAEVAEQTRTRKLKPDRLQGASFTISSLGGIGGTAFTPIINAPEVAILGVSRARMQPVYQEADGSFAPRLMLPLSFSYDHRVIDGVEAARFTRFLSDMLSDIRRLLL